MENESSKRRREKKPRQEWNPHWMLKALYSVWMAAFSVIKIALGAVATVLMIVLICGIVFVGILGDYLQEDILPNSYIDLSNMDLSQTSFFYAVDKDGNIQVLQQVHTSDDRQWASIEDIPESLVKAAVAIEDKRFYEHQGVDWITTIKACVNMFMGGDSEFGGSTITQQFIKNYTGDDAVTVQRKVIEIFKAQQFEKEYDKDVVMEWYLNYIYFGRGCYGVKSAAAEYFGKELQDLTVAECASLISITNNPSLYNPYRTSLDKGGKTGAERNRDRQLTTLNQMLEQSWITQEQYDEAEAQEMVFKSGIDDEDRWVVCKNESCGYEGTVADFSTESGEYFCPQCGNQTAVTVNSSQEVYSWFVDTAFEDVCKDLAALDGVDWDSLDTVGKKYYREKLQKGGYHIYTTIDLEVQAQADEIYQNLENIPTTKSTQQLQSGMVIIDNSTGDIVAIEGGVGEKVDHDAFSCATDAKLQTGSSQKPITVYAAAFESGTISPATVIKDLPQTYSGNSYWPKNDDRKYTYSSTILDGIRRSINAVAVHTLETIDLEYSYNFGKTTLGLSTLTDSYLASNGQIKSDIGYAPLGMGSLTVGATVRDMANAYATFANGGVYREARTYTKVYDSQGNLVLDNTQDTYQAISEKTANYLNYCLQTAAMSGTGSAAKFTSMSMNIAGKTGTTGDNKDRWFCGFTGYYTAAVWCGYKHPEQIKLTGNTSNPACRLWKMVLEPLHKGKSNVTLYDTSGFRSVTVCLDSGLLATDACRADVRDITRVSTAYCYSDDVPDGYCDKHVQVEWCTKGGGVATEYCKYFEDTEIKKVSLVKMTQDEIDELKKADDKGLEDIYTSDSYVYLVDKNGKDVAWHGFDGKANKKSDSPYLVCEIHTKEAYEKLKAEEEATAPSEPEAGIE